MNRPPIPKKLRAEAMAKNKGYCTWIGCAKPGTICEHLQTYYVVQEHKIENLEPRCADHALEKTKADMKVISKIRRLRGETGQLARRCRNGPQLKSNRKLATRPFQKKEK